MSGIIGNVLSLSYDTGKKRIDLYDFLRGLAMMIVLLQHSGIPGKEYLLTFHMPLFFFLSGIVSGNKELPSFGVYVWTRFKRLMVVYFVFGLLDISLYYIQGLIMHNPYDIKMAFLGIITGQYGFVPDAQSGIYWFLMVLFIADMLIYPINKYARNSLVILGGAIFFLILSYGSTHWFKLSVFTLDKAFMASFFLLLGSLFKPLRHYLEDLKVRWLEICAVLLCVFLVWLSKTHNSYLVLMYLNQYGDYGWFFLGALAGIVAAMLFGKYLYILLVNRKDIMYRLFMWIGFNSLIIFPVHLEIKQYFSRFYNHLGINNWLLLLITMIVLSVPICNFITKYLPWVLGQSKIKIESTRKQ